MAKLLEIVNEINNAIVLAQLGSKKFQKGRFNAIGELVVFKDEDTKITLPVITDNNGNSIKLSIDDINPFELYHRHITSTMSEEEENDYGDRILRTETSQMKMIVIGDRKKLKLTKEEIISAIFLGMPLEMPRTFLTTHSIQGVVITPGTFDNDYEKVYREEYNPEEIMLKPSIIFIALDYTIKTSIYTPCLELCPE